MVSSLDFVISVILCLSVALNTDSMPGKLKKMKMDAAMHRNRTFHSSVPYTYNDLFNFIGITHSSPSFLGSAVAQW